MSSRREPGFTENFLNPPVKPFNHAIRLRMAWRYKAMLDFVSWTFLVEWMVTSGFSLPVGIESVSEFLTIVCQDFCYDKRCLFDQVSQKCFGWVSRFWGLNFQEDPSCCPVNGHKGVFPGVFIGHLREIFHINMNKSRQIILEWFDGVCLRPDPVFFHFLAVVLLIPYFFAKALTKRLDCWISLLIAGVVRAFLCSMLSLYRLRSSACTKTKGDNLTEIQNAFQHMPGTE